MANTIRIKRRGSGMAGAPSSLASAELAFNEIDNTLYYGKGDSSGTATSIAAIGGDGAFVSLSGTQTISGNKTFSGTVSLGSSATATTPASNSNDTTLATTAFVTTKTTGFGSGSVTSVGLSLPAMFSVTGSPVTTSGTLTASLASQTANHVFIAPNGTAGAPTFRALLAADLPSLTGTYLGLSAGGTVSGNTTFSGTVALGASATATTPSTIDNSTKVATTAYVQNQGFLTTAVSSVGLSLPNIFTVSGSPVTLSGTLTASLASQTTNTVFAAPNGSTGAPTFRSLAAADIPTLTAAKISDFDTQVRTSRLDQMAAPTASVAFNSQKITGLADPTNAQDAATKLYVDNSRLGIDFKDSVRVATTANIATLAGGAPSTVDGVSVAANDRILVKNQTTTSQNGIYKVDTVGTGSNGSWSRTTDADGSPAGELTSGAFVYVEEGTANAQDQYVITTTGTITVGTTGITWGLFSGAGKITAGSGLSKSKDTLSISLAGSSGLETTSGLALTNTGVSAGSYQSVTVDAKGRVTAGTNPTTLSGYGITDAQSSDPTLTALAGVTTAADQIIYATGSDTFTTTALTSTARSLLDDTSTSAMRTTLGVAIGTDVQAYDATLAALAGVTTAADKLVYASGVDTFLTTDFTSTARTLLDDTSTSAMRTTLGVAIGTDVQAYNAALASIAGLTTVADRMIYTTASNTYAVTTLTSFGRSLVDDADASTARTTLGLGTMATQSASSVSITGGSIDNITIDGGTF